jgi:hypothetical protein
MGIGVTLTIPLLLFTGIGDALDWEIPGQNGSTSQRDCLSLRYLRIIRLSGIVMVMVAIRSRSLSLFGESMCLWSTGSRCRQDDDFIFSFLDKNKSFPAARSSAVNLKCDRDLRIEQSSCRRVTSCTIISFPLIDEAAVSV